jgi:hypothetical protein
MSTRHQHRSQRRRESLRREAKHQQGKKTKSEKEEKATVGGAWVGGGGVAQRDPRNKSPQIQERDLWNERARGLVIHEGACSSAGVLSRRVKSREIMYAGRTHAPSLLGWFGLSVWLVRGWNISSKIFFLCLSVCDQSVQEMGGRACLSEKNAERGGTRGRWTGSGRAGMCPQSQDLCARSTPSSIHLC